MTVPGFLLTMQYEKINFPEFLFVHEPKHADDLRDQDVLINGSTAKECRDKTRLLKSEYSAGVREIKKGVPTLKEAIDRYIEKRRNTLSPSTIDGYRRIQKNRFSSVMGMPLDEKTDWQAVCNAEALLCSPKTLRNAFRFVVSVLG